MSKSNDSFTFFAVGSYVVALALIVNITGGSLTWGSSWWLVVLFIALGVGFTGTSINRGDSEASAPVERLVSAPAAAPQLEAEVVETASDPVVEPDNLTKIEGIGPKMRDALIAQGVSTFAKLADQSLEEIRAAIEASGMRFAPSAESWAEQAGLAAQGDWDGLEKLQAILDSGRYPEGYEKQ